MTWVEEKIVWGVKFLSDSIFIFSCRFGKILRMPTTNDPDIPVSTFQLNFEISNSHKFGTNRVKAVIQESSVEYSSYLWVECFPWAGGSPWWSWGTRSWRGAPKCPASPSRRTRKGRRRRGALKRGWARIQGASCKPTLFKVATVKYFVQCQYVSYNKRNHACSPKCQPNLGDWRAED